MVSGFLTSPPVLRKAARIAIALLPSVFRIGRTTVVLRWEHVAEVLTRDCDFLLAPINRERIWGVSGPFFLGMDRSPAYFHQRACGYQAMDGTDYQEQSAKIRAQAARVLEESGRKLDVVGAYSRLIAGRTATRVFGVASPSETELLRVSRAIFHETFLNLSNDPEIRENGRAAGRELAAWTNAEIARRRHTGEESSDFLGSLLAQGRHDDDQIQHILNGYLVGSIDTTVTVVANILYELISDKTALRRARDDVDNHRRMWGWCCEALRRRPHNPLLVRETARDTQIGGKTVPAGGRVFAMTLSAHHDPAAFPAPGTLDPTRPLARYMHFGMGPHLCAGRDLTVAQVPILVAEVLRRNPRYVGRIDFEGPFPNRLTVGF